MQLAPSVGGPFLAAVVTVNCFFAPLPQSFFLNQQGLRARHGHTTTAANFSPRAPPLQPDISGRAGCISLWGFISTLDVRGRVSYVVSVVPDRRTTALIGPCLPTETRELLMPKPLETLVSLRRVLYALQLTSTSRGSRRLGRPRTQTWLASAFVILERCRMISGRGLEHQQQHSHLVQITAGSRGL
jgi:hypothetical protein